MRLLIAEPDPSLREAYERYFTRNGFQVTTAKDGSECVVALRQCGPDVLLLEPDGLEGLGTSLADAPPDELPLSQLRVIVLSRSPSEKIVLPNELSTTEHYLKPLPLAQLAAIMRRAKAS